ncbi:MAG: hypothetical protein LBC63_00115 [Holophagales bacterium]|nr:hypothetical protein [Holophagales bacterium]
MGKGRISQKTLTYKGYAAIVGWSEKEGRYVGDSVGLTKAVIEVCGATLNEARAEFADSIEWYLEYCNKEGIEPERPQINLQRGEK